MKMLLKYYYVSFLLIQKEKLKALKYIRKASSNLENVSFQKEAKIFLLTYNFEQSYNSIQITNK